MWHINYNRNIILLAAVFFAAVNSSFGQSYYHSPNDTIISSAVFDDINVFNIMQMHPTSDTLYFKWHKQSVVIPISWEASICDNGNCYTSLKDSGMMVPIVPGDNGLMSLHLDPKFETGTGIIRYTIFATSTALQVDTLTWIITAVGSTGIAEHKNVEPFIYSANGQLICKNLNGQFSKAWLFDMNGRLLIQQNINGSETTIPLQGFGKNMFIIRLSGKRNYTAKILNN
jgi:hypothetical protein